MSVEKKSLISRRTAAKKAIVTKTDPNATSTPSVQPRVLPRALPRTNARVLPRTNARVLPRTNARVLPRTNAR